MISGRRARFADQDHQQSPTDIRHVYQIKCAITVQGANGAGGKKLHCKDASVTMSYRLRDCTVHHRFCKEGRGSITVTDHNIDILLSNCAPDTLNVFMKTLDAKIKLASKPINTSMGRKPRTPELSNRARLLSELPQIFEKLSPLTLVEMHALKPGIAARPLGNANNNINGGSTPTRAQLPKRSLDDACSSSTPCSSKVVVKKRRLSSESVPSVTTTLTGITLSNEQKNVLRAVLSGASVFFTGSAGTGKSLLLTRIIGMLPADTTFVTAATGVAACHIGGVTLHAFAGIGAGDADLDTCIQLASRPSRVAQWRKCKQLIVDEVSMIDATFFTKLEQVARAVRRNDLPFGGIQLVLSGDFCQLPPVRAPQTNKSFCFQSPAWSRSVGSSMLLRQVRRQADTQFVHILNQVRYGRLSNESARILESTRHHELDHSGIIATRLCTHKNDAATINKRKLDAIHADFRDFVALDSETVPAKMDVTAASHIKLKVGAQVMLTKNIDLTRGLANGATGVVTSFHHKSGHPVVRFNNNMESVIGPHKHIIRVGDKVVIRAQIPLQLAWAISIHKSQGMSLDRVEISLGRVFEDGQAYVALSRARSLAGLRLVDFDRTCIRADPSVVRFYAQLEQTQHD